MDDDGFIIFTIQKYNKCTLAKFPFRDTLDNALMHFIFCYGDNTFNCYLTAQSHAFL